MQVNKCVKWIKLSKMSKNILTGLKKKKCLKATLGKAGRVQSNRRERGDERAGQGSEHREGGLKKKKKKQNKRTESMLEECARPLANPSASSFFALVAFSLFLLTLLLHPLTESVPTCAGTTYLAPSHGPPSQYARSQRRGGREERWQGAEAMRQGRVGGVRSVAGWQRERVRERECVISQIVEFQSSAKRQSPEDITILHASNLDTTCRLNPLTSPRRRRRHPHHDPQLYARLSRNTPHPRHTNRSHYSTLAWHGMRKHRPKNPTRP